MVRSAGTVDDAGGGGGRGPAAPPAPASPPRGPRRDASMSLLQTLMTDTLDDGYAAATARARAAGRPAGGVRGSAVLVVGLLAVGLLLATAAVRQRDRERVGTGTALSAEVQERTAANDRLAGAVADLRQELAETRGRALALSGAGTVAAERLEGLEAVTGVGPVTGPGVVLTVDDAEAPEPEVGEEPVVGASDPGRVRDGDLQDVVNGLWRAGAEAVSIDGQRLTSLTAIRSAGEAVLVAYRPLTPPYEVAAVGDPAALEQRFLDSEAGLVLQALEDNYGIRSDLRREEELRLPGASGTTLRVAAAAGRGGDGGGS
ncbi:DUF881 domain-containing protein [Vallicoccus soli]|uniref:DUF881 domain-containing protein n=1 Tax=Vallicoccus soli TaxID=2339232 RepID=UPI001402E9ED|nr:DUF881 domain-containing protein [Vallicoccus soli]